MCRTSTSLTLVSTESFVVVLADGAAQRVSVRDSGGAEEDFMATDQIDGREQADRGRGRVDRPLTRST